MAKSASGKNIERPHNFTILITSEVRQSVGHIAMSERRTIQAQVEMLLLEGIRRWKDDHPADPAASAA